MGFFFSIFELQFLKSKSEFYTQKNCVLQRANSNQYFSSKLDFVQKLGFCPSVFYEGAFQWDPKAKMHFFKTPFSIFRFLSLTSQTPQYWMTSNRITQITTGMVYFTFVYGIGATICNALLEWNIFPTYTVCLVDAVVEKELDNSVVLAFFVMPSLLMAYTTPIIDLVTFRLMKFWSNQSRQIPKGTLPNCTFLSYFDVGEVGIEQMKEPTKYVSNYILCTLMQDVSTRVGLIV